MGELEDEVDSWRRPAFDRRDHRHRHRGRSQEV